MRPSEEIDQRLTSQLERFNERIAEEMERGSRANWMPQSGPQQLFLQCPCREVLLEGTRGSSKTDALLMDFLQHTQKGYGPEWRGILFRETYKQLEHIISKTKQFFRPLTYNPVYNSTAHTWVFPEGEELLLRFMRVADDYWDYHGHEYPWIGWEELTNWKDDQCYEMMKACNRSSNPFVPRKYRSNANPFGIGHHWVKAYFITPIPVPTIVVEDRPGWNRTRIHATVYDNKILMEADPSYVDTLRAISDPNLKKAWLEGSWDIVAGGALTDVWDEKIHFIEPFEIPSMWYRDRSFDWGSSRPFAVLWWAEADGHEVRLKDGETRWFPKGTKFITAEYYGWTGKPNTGNRMPAMEIARNIIEIEKSFATRRVVGGSRPTANIQPGPSDPMIWDSTRGESIAAQMGKIGVKWERGDNSPGSRIRGLEALRQYLYNSKQFPMEDPGLFVFNTCEQWRRTVPVIPRDEKKLEDVDSDSEDH